MRSWVDCGRGLIRGACVLRVFAGGGGLGVVCYRGEAFSGCWAQCRVGAVLVGGDAGLGTGF